MASSSPSDHEARVHTLFGAAYREKVSRFKALAKQLDTEGIGIRRTISGMRDCLDQTALHAAAAGGNRDACDYLINEVKLDIEAKNKNGETPLFKAIQGEQFATAMHLLNKGARPNVTNNTSFSPLYYAAEKGHGELLHLLVSKGAYVDALSCTGTPLQRAASRRNEEAVKILLDNQAN